MLTFLSVAILIYGAMHIYAFGKLWASLPHSLPLGLVLTSTGIVLTFSPLLVRLFERQGWHQVTVVAAWMSYTWMGYLLVFLCIGLLFDLGHALAKLFKFTWPLTDAMTLRIVAALALATMGYGLVEAHRIRVEQVSINTPKLPPGRLRIALISDLHLGAMQGQAFLGRVIARLRELKPDIIVATGDIVDGQGDDLAVLARDLGSYEPRLGAYAVTGNHEFYAGLENSLRFLRGAGFTVLRGQSARVGGIVLVGVDDPAVARSQSPADREAHKTTLLANDNDFVVLLKHQPVVTADIPFDLQLSGHVHGGQIFPLVYLTRLFYGTHTGLTALAGGRRLYVSRGVGTWGPPIRVLAPPEISLITIVGTGP